MTKALITPPAALPVTLAELKSHLRFEADDEDGYLGDLLAAATAHVEVETGRCLLSQTWRVYLDSWPDECRFELPVSPARAIAEARVYDADGTPAMLAPGDWTLDGVSDPPRLHLAAPADPETPMNGIEIDVEAGYGDAATDVPDTLRRAVMVLAAHWFEHRGADIAGSVPDGFRRLIAPFRRPLL